MVGDVLPYLVGIFAIFLGAGCGYAIAAARFASLFNGYENTHQQLVNDLSAIADRVQTGVDVHSQRIREIDNDLGSTESSAGGNAEAHAAVNELAIANTQLQTELEKAKRELNEQSAKLHEQQVHARTDALTLLHNRRSFDESLNNLVTVTRAGQQFGALLMIDIDKFKQFNDQFGHIVGDEVLKHVARTLRQTVLGLDVSICRYGGEEIALIISAAASPRARVLHEAKALAMLIRSAIEDATPRYENLALSVTASIGLAVTEPGLTETNLITHADAALYAAKSAGHLLSSRRHCSTPTSAAPGNGARCLLRNPPHFSTPLPA